MLSVMGVFQLMRVFLMQVVGYMYIYKLPYLLDKVLERWCGVVEAGPFAMVEGE
jgi:hypothetical protein